MKRLWSHAQLALHTCSHIAPDPVRKMCTSERLINVTQLMVAFCAYSLVMGWFLSGSVCDLGIDSNKVLCVALAWNCGPMG